MTTGPLVRFESRQVTVHPLIGLGVLGTLLICLVMYGETDSEPFWYTALTLQPTFLLGPAALLATNRAATRERRAATVEVLDGVPTTSRARTRAVSALLATSGPRRGLLLTGAVAAVGAGLAGWWQLP
jgi:hypothetical protein